MKRIVLIGAIALLAACGNSSKKADVDATGGETSVPSADVSSADSIDGSDDTIVVDGSDDTIVVEDFGDMPPACIELLGEFLKQMEPKVSEVDWESVTLAEFEDLSAQFSAESDAFDAQTAAAGCDKYSLSGSDESQFQAMADLAAAEAPGTLGYIEFLASLSESQNATAGSLPEDCSGTIAAIEAFLTKGTMQDLPVSEVGVVGQLMGSLSTKCTPEETSAFMSRDDVKAFVGN